MAAATVSVIIIARDEAEILPVCLAGLAWADEIIVVDNGSTDATPEIARRAGATVVSAPGRDFAELRTTGLKAATGTWVLYVDADERVPAELQQEIRQLLLSFEPERDPHGYFLRRRNYYLGRLWPEQDKMQRLFWKSALKRWHGPLHETADIDGTYGTLRHPLDHYTHRSLEAMVAKTNEWSEIEATLRLKAQHPPVVGWRLIRVFLTGFLGTFVRQKGWKAGTVGWIESVYQGFSYIITYAKLWEKQQS